VRTVASFADVQSDRLDLIGKHIDASNVEELLVLAEENNAKELERGHCHINRFYWSVLTPFHAPVSINSMG
jgi:hypothetical protein